MAIRSMHTRVQHAKGIHIRLRNVDVDVDDTINQIVYTCMR